MALDRKNLRFNGWGKLGEEFDLKGRQSEVWRWLGQELQMPSMPATPARSLKALNLPKSRLEPSALKELSRCVHGDGGLKSDDFERAFHAVGKSYADLLRIRGGQGVHYPDAIVYPKSAQEVADVLSLCAEQQFCVIPFGGGSSVVGGVEARGTHGDQPVITLDTSELDRLVDLDECSQTATFEAGIYGPALEAALGRRGFTLGHYPQSFEFSTLGGWIAARGSGQQSNRYGGAAKMLRSAVVSTPAGVWRTAAHPASAAGPDLNGLIAGSEGTLGVITRATMRIQKRPEEREFVSILFPDWSRGVEACRLMVQEGLPLATLRLSDAEETRFYGAFRQVLKPSWTQKAAGRALELGGYGQSCVLLVGLEGSIETLARTRRRILSIGRSKRGFNVGRGPGQSWYSKRFAMPYLRDPLLDRGVGIDTLETCTTWSNMHRLYRGVSEALRGALAPFGGGMVMSHLSHSYPDGASLYFTYLFPRAGDEVAQWRKIKTGASNAIETCGGTLSHHHGVGTDHAPWLPKELGEVGMAALRGYRGAIDPNGIMNPGKVDPGERSNSAGPRP